MKGGSGREVRSARWQSRLAVGDDVGRVVYDDFVGRRADEIKGESGAMALSVQKAQTKG